MNQPIAHQILGTTSNEFDDGDCDYCLVPVTAELLGYMDKVSRLYAFKRGDGKSSITG